MAHWICQPDRTPVTWDDIPGPLLVMIRCLGILIILGGSSHESPEVVLWKPSLVSPLAAVISCITHRIHGAAIYGNMDPINIPQMLAYIYIYTIHGSYGLISGLMMVNVGELTPVTDHKKAIDGMIFSKLAPATQMTLIWKVSKTGRSNIQKIGVIWNMWFPRCSMPKCMGWITHLHPHSQVCSQHPRYSTRGLNIAQCSKYRSKMAHFHPCYHL